MDSNTAISLSSFIIAVIALAAAITQVTIQFSVEQRRKGKTDKLALGDWAITWPQARLLLCLVLQPFGIKSPWGDPRLLSVPFITIAAIEQYLRAEARATQRQPLGRRMKTRLVESASRTIASGGGHFTGRMYAVRETTRKRSEACWSDAMDMCGLTRKFWPLLTGVSAQACDGAVRPANAVTNLHSLWGYARTMGLRDCIREGTKVTFTNGGASIYLDQYAGPDRPTRLAHFSGSPNGRYKIIEEMSQQTGQSVYADGVWSNGRIPLVQRLEVTTPDGTDGLGTGTANDHQIATEQIRWPASVELQQFARKGWPEIRDAFKLWADTLLKTIRGATQASAMSDALSVDIVQFVERRNAAVVSCIRGYPVDEMSPEERLSCNKALLWCIDHWWLNPYQARALQYTSNANGTLWLPVLETTTISCEFVTDCNQAIAWCQEVLRRDSMDVETHCWEACRKYAFTMVDTPSTTTRALSFTEHCALVKVLQCWRLFLLFGERELQATDPIAKELTTCQLVLLTMALVAITSDSSKIGSVEDNKAMEIELG